MVERPLLYVLLFHAATPIVITLPVVFLKSMRAGREEGGIGKGDASLIGTVYGGVLFTASLGFSYLAGNGQVSKMVFPDESVFQATSLVSYMAVVVATMYALRRHRVNIRARFFTFQWKAVSRYLGVAVFLLLTLVLWAAYSRLSGLNSDGVGVSIGRQHSPRLAPLLIYGILGPIAEEIYYRGVALGVVSNYCGPFWATIAVSLYYSLSHFTVSLSVLPWHFLMGVIYTLIYLKYRSLFPGILVHAAKNIIALSP
jgi:membrane protease YdiL (CAAX protease family)